MRPFDPGRVSPMRRPLPVLSNTRGFTLLEIAIVMVIIGLLTGGGVTLVKVLTERKARNASMEYLQQARAALIGFAANNGRLPWADGTPAAAGDGIEDAGTTNGFLPYQSLQITPSDPYKRILRYEVNSALTVDRSVSCAGLKAGLSGRPLVVDADGAGAAFRVAAVLVSAGPMDASGSGNVFDAVTSGTHQGNNASGTPNYLRHPATQSFDDLSAYIGGNELFGLLCEYLDLAVNNTSGSMVYVYDATRASNLGSVANNDSALFNIISGTRIEVRSAAGGGGVIVSPSLPPTPLMLAGRGATINLTP